MDNSQAISIAGGIVAIIISISTFLKNHYVSKAATEKEFSRAQLDAQRASELSKIFLEYERRFTKLEIQAELFYKVIEKDIGDMLHSPHRAALDRLIEKNNDPDQEFTREDAIEMVYLLDEIMEKEKLTQSEKFGITVHKASLISRYGLKEFVSI